VEIEDVPRGRSHSLPYAGIAGSGSKGVISVPVGRDTPSELYIV